VAPQEKSNKSGGKGGSLKKNWGTRVPAVATSERKNGGGERGKWATETRGGPTKASKELINRRLFRSKKWAPGEFLGKNRAGKGGGLSAMKKEERNRGNAGKWSVLTDRARFLIKRLMGSEIMSPRAARE